MSYRNTTSRLLTSRLDSTKARAPNYNKVCTSFNSYSSCKFWFSESTHGHARMGRLHSCVFNRKSVNKQLSKSMYLRCILVYISVMGRPLEMWSWSGDWGSATSWMLRRGRWGRNVRAEVKLEITITELDKYFTLRTSLSFRVSPTELAMFGIQYRGFHVEDLPTSDIYRYKFGEIDNINLILISDTCWWASPTSMTWCPGAGPSSSTASGASPGPPPVSSPTSSSTRTWR